MGIGKCFKMAISSIINNKMRSLLTMLGIIIGIAAVIILVSIMNGLKGEIASSFSDFGITALTVNVQRRANKGVNPDELFEFIENHSDLYTEVSPTVNTSGKLKTAASGDDTLSSTCKGVSEYYSDIQSLDISFGRFISFSDCENSSRVAVIGTYPALYFFEECESAIGQTIRINGTPYEIVGVLEEKEDSTQYSGDDIVYIPYTTALKASGTSIVSSYSVNAASEKTIEQSKSTLEAFMLEKIGDSDYFSVVSMQEMIDSMTEMIDQIEIILIAIAGISLLVGGIGIMNIMLVSVSERTREIGIRKSLGAKHRHLMMQFVIESGTVSCIGGIFGIILGSILSAICAKVFDMQISPSIGAILLAFGVSVGIGIIFGFLPARKAAKLNPIDALRSD